MSRQLFALGLAALVAACQAAAPAPAPQPSATAGAAATPPPKAVLARARHSRRVARPIPDPAPGRELKVASYWKLAPAEPFEVVDALVTHRPGAGGAAIEVAARVVLPSRLGAAKALRLLELDEADDEAEGKEIEEAAEAGEVDGDGEEVEGDEPLDDEPLDDATLAADEDLDGDGVPEFEIAYVYFEDDDLPDEPGEDADELAAALPDEDDFLPTFDAAADDVPDDLPDYVFDADGDDLLEADETRPYVEPLTQAQKARVMAPGHDVELVFEDRPMMGDLPDLCTVIDETAGDRLAIELDQDQNRLTLRNEAGTLTFALEPDDTMRVGDRPAKDAAEAARLMAAEPVVKATSTHVLAMLFVRRARAPLPETRGKYPCNTDDRRFSGDQSNRSLDGTAGNSYRLLGVPAPTAFYDPVGDMLRLLIQGRVGRATVQALEAMAQDAGSRR